MSDYRVIVDLEGTCCEDDGVIAPDDRETIEIGAVMLSPEFDELGCFSAIVRPVVHPTLTEFCTQLTGITQQMVDNAETFDTVFRLFMDWATHGPPVTFGSWGRYDIEQFGRDFKRIGSDEPDELSGWVNWAHEFKKKTGRRCRHTRAMKALCLTPVGNTHRGLDDARNIAQIIPLLVNGE